MGSGTFWQQSRGRVQDRKEVKEMERQTRKRGSCLRGDAATKAVCQCSRTEREEKREGSQVAIERGRGGREGRE